MALWVSHSCPLSAQPLPKPSEPRVQGGAKDENYCFWWLCMLLGRPYDQPGSLSPEQNYHYCHVYDRSSQLDWPRHRLRLRNRPVPESTRFVKTQSRSKSGPERGTQFFRQHWGAVTQVGESPDLLGLGPLPCMLLPQIWHDFGRTKNRGYSALEAMLCLPLLILEHQASSLLLSVAQMFYGGLQN